MAKVGDVTDLLREPLSADRGRLLQAILDSLAQSGERPVCQYVDLTLDLQFGVDAAAVLGRWRA